MALLVDPVVAGAVFLGTARKHRRHLVHAHVEIGVVLGLAGDDQRRARLVDQDRIDFIDNGEIQAALHALVGRIDHVVAQVVEAEFVVGAVGDVGRVGRLLGLVVHLRQIDADRQAEETMQTPHPLGIAAGQIVVDGNDMHAIAGQRIEVAGQRGHQRLAFTGTHFGDLAVMQHHAADHLHVEVAHAEHALAGLANNGKGFGQAERRAFRPLARRAP